MRGTKSMAVAVRAPDGHIVVHSESLNPKIYGKGLARVPFLRGMTLLWDTLVLGMRTLMFSAEIAVQDNRQALGLSDSGEEPETIWSAPMAWGSIALSLFIAMGLFFVLPALLTQATDSYVPNALLSNLLEGVIRFIFVIAYIWGVGHLADIRRVFGYHGAEHKTVHAYEAGVPLTVENVRHYSTSHPRCGTSFILVIVAASILVFSLFGRPPILVRIGLRIALLPLIVGIAYEWLKLSVRHAGKWWVRAVLWPGLMMQKLTAREPDDGMLEVAIAALTRVLEEDGQLVLSEEAAVAV